MRLAGWLLYSASAVALFAVQPQVAAAQTAASPAGAGATTASTNAGASTVEDVVVTATKSGAARVQDIPSSITAIGSVQLEQQRILKFTDYVFQVPSLSFSDGGPGEKRYVIRGIRSSGQQQVAVYYDEVPDPGIQGSGGDSGSQQEDVPLYDLDRIEVLKGPQSTLYGANSETGVIRYITKKPVLNRFEGSVQTAAEATDNGGDPSYNAYGMLNMPILGDKLGVRFVGYYDYAGGYVSNVRLNIPNQNWSKNYGGRVELRFQPTPTTTIDGAFWINTRYVGGSSGYMPYDTFHTSGNTSDPGYKDTVPQFAFFQTGLFNNGDYVNSARNDFLRIYTGTLTQEVGTAGTFTLAASDYSRKDGFFRDNTWSIISLGTGPAGATCLNGRACVRPDLFPELTNQTQSVYQDTVEARFAGNQIGPFTYVAGLFYRHRKSPLQSVSPIVNPTTGMPYPITTIPTGFSIAPGAGTTNCVPCALARFTTRTINEKAAFGELTWHIGQFELLGGLREYNAAQSDNGFYTFQFPLLASTLPAPSHAYFSETKLLKKLEGTYHVNSDVLVYALASQGSRLGGTNAASTFNVPPGYNSDTVWNYEGGIKSQWWDRRLTFNSDVFVMNWANLQVSGRDPSGAFGFIGNAGSAQFIGWETEMYLHPITGLDLSASWLWLPKRELTQDQISTTIRAPGKKGSKLPGNPEWSASFTGQYTHELAIENWSGFARAEFSYRGRSNSELDPSTITNRIYHPYEIVNFKLGASNSMSGLDLQVYLNNAFNSHGVTSISAATATPTTLVSVRPRTVGVSLAKKF